MSTIHKCNVNISIKENVDVIKRRAGNIGALCHIIIVELWQAWKSPISVFSCWENRYHAPSFWLDIIQQGKCVFFLLCEKSLEMVLKDSPAVSC